MPHSLGRFRASTSFTNAVIALAIFTDLFLYGLIVPFVPWALKERAGVSEDDSE